MQNRMLIHADPAYRSPSFRLFDSWRLRIAADWAFLMEQTTASNHSLQQSTASIVRQAQKRI